MIAIEGVDVWNYGPFVGIVILCALAIKWFANNVAKPWVTAQIESANANTALLTAVRDSMMLIQRDSNQFLVMLSEHIKKDQEMSMAILNALRSCTFGRDDSRKGT